MQVLVLHMLSNLGLYPGHLEYSVMSLWVLFKSYRKFLLLLFLASSSPGKVQSASPNSPSMCFGSTVSSVFKAFAIAFWTCALLNGHAATWEVVYLLIVLNIFGVLIRTRSMHVQLRGERRSSQTTSRIPFWSFSLSATSFQFPRAPL